MKASRVVVPYTHPPLWQWPEASATGRDVRYVDVSAGPTEYWRTLARLWAAGEDFTVVEHDVIPTVRALDDLDACPEPYCAQPYPYFNGTNWGLACTRFRASAMVRVPGLWRDVAGMWDALHPPMHWCRLDSWSHQVLGRHGVDRHDHSVRVWHSHTDTSHGCEVPGGHLR